MTTLSGYGGENARLKEENELLKKAAIYFARESK
jgi:transposase-like protein